MADFLFKMADNKDLFIAPLVGLMGVLIGITGTAVHNRTKFKRSVFDDFRLKRLEAHQSIFSVFTELFQKLVPAFKNYEIRAIEDAYNNIFPVYLKVVADNTIWADTVFLNTLHLFSEKLKETVELCISQKGISRKQAEEVWIQCIAIGDVIEEVCRQQSGVYFLEKRMYPFTKLSQKVENRITKLTEKNYAYYSARKNAREQEYNRHNK